MDIDTQWQHIKDTWTSTCKEILGKKKCQNKEWISADTISKMQVRKEKKGIIKNSRTRAAKAAAQKQHAEANRAKKHKNRQRKTRQPCQGNRRCCSPRKHRKSHSSPEKSESFRPGRNSIRGNEADVETSTEMLHGIIGNI